MFEKTFEFVHSLFPEQKNIYLHEPCLGEIDKKYLSDCIDSGFVSSAGSFVNTFEKSIETLTQSKHAIAVVNGTAALHASMVLAGVDQGSEVLTQSLTFIATCNAIKYCQAEPAFIDIEHKSLSMDPNQLEDFFKKDTILKQGQRINKHTQKKVSAVMPVHTFGNSCFIADIQSICLEAEVPLIEDASESLGTWMNQQHTGTFGQFGILSFNGNKIITTGGGGMILTNDDKLAAQARHITTTAKTQHPYESIHDQIAYNYRMPNLNAALGCAQLEKFDALVSNKRELYKQYLQFFQSQYLNILEPIEHSFSNHWLNTLILSNLEERNIFLQESLEQGIHCRPVWKPMHQLDMYCKTYYKDLSQTDDLADRIVNLPSSSRGL